MKKCLFSINIFVFFMMTAWGCQRNADQKKINENKFPKAAEFVLQSVKGDTVRLSDFRGKVLILDIWDTWCPPCRMEIPDFVQLNNQYKEEGFSIIGIALGQEGKEKVQSFIQEYHIPYPVALANKQVLKDYGPISGIPTTFVINKKGEIVKTYIGFKPKETFENDIKFLLKE